MSEVKKGSIIFYFGNIPFILPSLIKREQLVLEIPSFISNLLLAYNPIW